MPTKSVYIATDHGYSEYIPTPPRHPLNPPHSGAPDWRIVESKYSDKGVKLIWQCEITTLPGGAKPPSKFHPHAGKPKPPAKNAKPRPKPPAKKPAPKPAPLVAPAKAPRPKSTKSTAEIPAAGK